MHPYGEDSPIKNFLDKNINGAIHHICLEVKDINKTAEELKKKNMRILGDGIPKNGAHNKPVYFFIKMIFWNINRIRTGVILLYFRCNFCYFMVVNFIFNSSYWC